MCKYIYVAQMFPYGAEILGDCLGLFASAEDATEAAIDEIVRVMCIPVHERDEGMDWADTFQVMRYPADDDEAEGVCVVARRGVEI